MEQKDKGEKVSCFEMGVEKCNGNGAEAETAIHGNRRSNIFPFFEYTRTKLTKQ